MAATLLLLGLVILSCVIIWFLQTSKFRHHLNKIPGPPTIPIFGNALQMTTGPEWYKQVLSWGNQFRSDGIYVIWLFNKPVVGVTRAETAEVLLKSSKHIDKASEYVFLHPWLGTGLLTSTADKWRSRRKMLTPTFHFRILHDFLDVFNRQALVLVAKLQGHVGRGPFNVFQDIALCALDIICETAMGKHVNAQTADSDYVRAVYKMCGLVEKRMRSPWHWNRLLYHAFGPGKEHDQHLKTLKDFTVGVIKDRMNNFDYRQVQTLMENSPDDGDVVRTRKVQLAFLDMLLYLADQRHSLTVEDIQEEVDTFMFEGHDTTGAAMNWCLHLIGSNQKVQEKVHEELDSVFGDSDRMPTAEDLKELKYLECCIKEALRLFPSVPYFGRTTTEECNIGPYTVPQGVTVIIFTAAIHKDERWFPDPERFDPDRFLPDHTHGKHPYSYIPFSAGLRNCIGQKFALLEEKAVLSAILRNFRVKSCQSREELLPVGEIILRPKEGIVIQLENRCKK